jgi:hypothetical protein
MPAISFRKQEAIVSLERRGYSDIRKLRSQMFQRMDTWNPGCTVKSVCETISLARSQGLLPDILVRKLLKSSPLEEQVEVYRKMGDGASPWILLTEIALRRVS